MFNLIKELLLSYKKNKINFIKFPIFLRFLIKGYGNNLLFKSRMVLSKLQIEGNNNYIELNENVCKRISINIEGNNNKIIIKHARDISNLVLVIKDNNNTIFIDENTGIGGARIVCMGDGKFINIGKSCMLSDNIEIWNYDGHTIYDSEMNIINKPKSIIIEDNVWIGRNVSILKGSHIGKGSIVGMNSLIPNKIVKNNTLVAGSPIKIIKEDISWNIGRYYE